MRPRVIDAAFGLSRDYDGFVLGVAPFQFALAAAALQDNPLSYGWVVRDLHRLFVAEEKAGVSDDYRLLAGVWLAHLLATLPRTDVDGGVSPDEARQMYASIETCAQKTGGVPAGWHENPPSPNSELDDLKVLIASIDGKSELPGFEELARFSSGYCVPELSDSLQGTRWCLEALIGLDAYVRPTAELISLLASGRDRK